jgi:DNA-directed RNA polymerase specialized sigma subunit
MPPPNIFDDLVKRALGVDLPGDEVDVPGDPPEDDGFAEWGGRVSKSDPKPDHEGFFGPSSPPAPAPIPKSKEQPLLETWMMWKKTPDKATSRLLLQQAAPAIRTGISYHAGGGSRTLEGQAKLKVLDAARTYDPSKGASLSTHIINTLAGLRRDAIKATNVLSVGEVAYRQHQYLRQQEEEFRDQHGRDPDDEELADYSKIADVERVRKLKRFRPGVSLDQIQRSSVDSEDDLFEPPVEKDDSLHYATIVRDASDNPKERFIIDHTFGLEGKKVYEGKEIARRLGVTEGLISQLKLKIQKRIDALVDNPII